MLPNYSFNRKVKITNPAGQTIDAMCNGPTNALVCNKTLI
jgi:hypothetical protein